MFFRWPTRPQPVTSHYLHTWCPSLRVFCFLGTNVSVVACFFADGRTYMRTHCENNNPLYGRGLVGQLVYCSSDDTTFYPYENELKEYLLNDTGKIFKGSYNHIIGRHWVYGQFDDAVLPACCFIMDKSGLSPTERGNPIKVARAISAMVNSVDDNGMTFMDF